MVYWCNTCRCLSSMSTVCYRHYIMFYSCSIGVYIRCETKHVSHAKVTGFTCLSQMFLSVNMIIDLRICVRACMRLLRDDEIVNWEYKHTFVLHLIPFHYQIIIICLILVQRMMSYLQNGVIKSASSHKRHRFLIQKQWCDWNHHRSSQCSRWSSAEPESDPEAHNFL